MFNSDKYCGGDNGGDAIDEFIFLLSEYVDMIGCDFEIFDGDKENTYISGYREGRIRNESYYPADECQ